MTISRSTQNLEIRLDMIKNIYLSGGGAKGMALLGFFLILDYLGYLKQIENIGGTSVGAFMGFGISIGHSPKSLMERTYKRVSEGKLDNFRDFILENLHSPRPHFFKQLFLFLKHLINIPFTRGIYHGQHIENEIEWMIEDSDLPPAIKTRDLTFAQLHEHKMANPHLRLKDLFTVTHDALKHQDILCSHLTTPEWPIRIAVRASMAVPGIYKPVYYDGKMLVDGGVKNNIVLGIFKEKEKTLGVSLMPFSFLHMRKPDFSRGIFRYAKAYVFTKVFYFMSLQLQILKYTGDLQRVHELDATGIGLLNFSLTRDELTKILARGAYSALKLAGLSGTVKHFLYWRTSLTLFKQKRCLQESNEGIQQEYAIKSHR